MAADWTDRRNVAGLDRDEFHAVQREMAESIRTRGATFARFTLLPDADNPVEFVVEGWRVQPDDQGPLPRMAADGTAPDVYKQIGDAIGLDKRHKLEPAPQLKPAFPARALDNSAAGQAPIIPHEE